MLVRELMTTELVTADPDAPLARAVEAMLEARAGSAVVVSSHDAPVGIVTNSDVLRATLETQAGLTDVLVEEVMSEPLVTTDPGTTVNRALELMAEHGVKKLPVIDGMSLVGVVTTTDIARQLPEHIAAVRSLEAKAPRERE